MLFYYCQEKKAEGAMFLIKDFNTFMYDYRLHLGRKQFCYYSLQVFSTEEILKRHIKDVILKIALKLMVNK